MSSLANLTDLEARRLFFAVRLLLANHAAQPAHNPCAAVFTADTGWRTPLHACACDWPRWTLSELVIHHD